MAAASSISDDDDGTGTTSSGCWAGLPFSPKTGVSCVVPSGLSVKMAELIGSSVADQKEGAGL